jgi:hypothetical protein
MLFLARTHPMPGLRLHKQHSISSHNLKRMFEHANTYTYKHEHRFMVVV